MSFLFFGYASSCIKRLYVIILVFKKSSSTSTHKDLSLSECSRFKLKNISTYKKNER